MIADVVIVGGGPAGSTAAYLLSGWGMRVLLLDKHRFPRPKLCGGLLTAKTSALVSRIFGVPSPELDRLSEHVAWGYGLYYRRRPILEDSTEEPFRLVRREVYDAFLLEKAREAGAEVLEGERVVDLDPEDPERMVIRTAKGRVLKARFILGADGVKSLVRRRLGFSEKAAWRRGLALALEVSIPRRALPVAEPRVYLGYVRTGYAWAFPRKEDLLLGIGALLSEAGGLSRAFGEFLSDLGIELRQGPRAHLIPFGNFLRRPARGRVLLAGDAAGLVEPLLGEGIFYAHRSGELAARALRLHLEQGHPLEEIYPFLLEQNILPQLRQALKLRGFFFRRAHLLSRNPFRRIWHLLRRPCLDVVHGKRHYFLSRWMSF
ncbi:MAG TPA: geranylgeranyl reductase family protein [Thermosulfurimonas dismutans]|uniref:Geranylgeranyl reductase family protein n=1 Tax=Thermosulfurimonas dismutans TaxID=999894 RepID=A0A7C3GK70_9BACT|nr:geranylgeranyl reductase family protein [Thermosulfurimonas dismutans]